MKDDQVSFVVYAKPPAHLRGDWYQYAEYETQKEAVAAAKALVNQSYRIVRETARVLHALSHDAIASREVA